MTFAPTKLRSDQLRQPLVNTTSYWEEHAAYVPKNGEMIIYSDGDIYEENGQDVVIPKIKIGDGSTTVGDLRFTDEHKKVQPDWNQDDSGADDYIKHKPTIPTVNDATLTIQADGVTVNTFSANDNSAKNVNFKSGTGVKLNGNANDKTITVSTENNHTVISKNEIVKAQNGAKLYYYQVRCDLNGSELKVADMSDTVPASKAYSYVNNYVWTKQASETGRYLGICKIQSIEGRFVFKIDIYNSVKATTVSHYFCLLADAPSDSTFTFVSTCDWEIIVRLNSSSHRLLAYMKVPDSFDGTVTLTPLRKNVTAGAVEQISSFDYSSGTTIRDYYWYNQLPDGSQSLDTLTELAEYAPVTDNPSSNLYLRTPAGNYFVNIIGDFGGNLGIGSKISDVIINDYFLHTLERRVELVLEENANILPSFENNAGKVLTVNNDENGVEWVQQSGAGVFVCVFTGTDTITCDKTVAQIYEAYQNHKEVIGTLSTSYYRLGYINNVGTAIFFSVRSYNGVTIDKLTSTNGGTTWNKSNITLQEILVSGTNIKTLNGNSLLGAGDVEIGDTLCYCISNTGASTSSVVAVDVTHPSGFSPRNGSMLLVHFNTDVPAASSLTVTGTTLTNLYLVYRQVGIASGILKAGDKALIYCINSVAFVIAIDRQSGGDVEDWQTIVTSDGDTGITITPSTTYSVVFIDNSSNNSDYVVSINDTGIDIVFEEYDDLVVPATISARFDVKKFVSGNTVYASVKKTIIDHAFFGVPWFTAETSFGYMLLNAGWSVSDYIDSLNDTTTGDYKPDLWKKVTSITIDGKSYNMYELWLWNSAAGHYTKFEDNDRMLVPSNFAFHRTQSVVSSGKSPNTYIRRIYIGADDIQHYTATQADDSENPLTLIDFGV